MRDPGACLSPMYAHIHVYIRACVCVRTRALQTTHQTPDCYSTECGVVCTHLSEYERGGEGVVSFYFSQNRYGLLYARRCIVLACRRRRPRNTRNNTIFILYQCVYTYAIVK